MNTTTKHAAQHSDICAWYLCEYPEYPRWQSKACVDETCRECVIGLIVGLLDHNNGVTDVQHDLLTSARLRWEHDAHLVRAIDLLLNPASKET